MSLIQKIFENFIYKIPQIFEMVAGEKQKSLKLFQIKCEHHFECANAVTHWTS